MKNRIMQTEKYKIYKGLQRPLVFKSFKGKFIYYEAGLVVGGIVVAGICAAVVSSLIGLILLIAIVVPGSFKILSMQKKGLHSKSNESGIVIHQPSFKVKR